MNQAASPIKRRIFAIRDGRWCQHRAWAKQPHRHFKKRLRHSYARRRILRPSASTLPSPYLIQRPPPTTGGRVYVGEGHPPAAGARGPTIRRSARAPRALTFTMRTKYQHSAHPGRPFLGNAPSGKTAMSSAPADQTSNRCLQTDTQCRRRFRDNLSTWAFRAPEAVDGALGHIAPGTRSSTTTIGVWCSSALAGSWTATGVIRAGRDAQSA